MQQGSNKAGEKRKRIDWEAVERDYRTGKFTLRELEARHGAGYAMISREAKKRGWSKDLREVIREATAAAVIRETVAKATAEAQTATTDAVLVAAEVSKQVILQHRGDLRSARDVAMNLLGELQAAAPLQDHVETLTLILAGQDPSVVGLSRAEAAVTKAVSLGSRVSSIKALAETLAKLQAAERVAFDLDSGGEEKPTGLPEQLAEFVGELHRSGAGRLPVAKRAPK